MSNFSKKPNEHLFQFVEEKLNDGTYLFDDEEAVVEYEAALNRKGSVDNFGAPTEQDEDGGIYINAVVMIGEDGQPTDSDVLELLSPESLERIRSEVSTILN